MKTITKKKRIHSNSKMKTLTSQSRLMDKDILKAVHIQVSMREKYRDDKDWNSVDVIRKFRFGI
ncbi:MAG: hypothetical protein ABI840_12775 [bacterium]